MRHDHSDMCDRPTAVERVCRLRVDALAGQPTATVSLADTFEGRVIGTALRPKTQWASSPILR